jgi:hypothetical protein
MKNTTERNVAMKMILFAVTALAVLVTEAKPDKYKQLATVAGRARCVSRELKDGLVIETWKRGNFTWANTNVQKRVISARQTNTFEDKLAKLRNDVSDLHVEKKHLTDTVDSIKKKVEDVKVKAKEKKKKHEKHAGKGVGDKKKAHEETVTDLDELISILDEIDRGAK